MNKKIEKLTAQQQMDLLAFRDRWFRIGCSTEPADRPRAEAAITEMYAVIGKPKPQFIWFASPATACLGRQVLLQGGTKKMREKLGS